MIVKTIPEKSEPVKGRKSMYLVCRDLFVISADWKNRVHNNKVLSVHKTLKKAKDAANRYASSARWKKELDDGQRKYDTYEMELEIREVVMDEQSADYLD